MEPLEELLAIEAIKQMKSRYFQAVDEKDYRLIEQLFTEDAIVDFTAELRHHVGHHGVNEEVLRTPVQPVTGGVETARVIADAVDGLVTVHHGHDPQITLLGPDTATGRWSMYDILEYPDETMHGFGHYHEEYVRQGQDWRFSKLTLTRLRVTWEPRPSARL